MSFKGRFLSKKESLVGARFHRYNTLMGQHRTRKQKEHAQLMRQITQTQAYSLKDISLSASSITTTSRTEKNATQLQQEEVVRSYIKKDMMKTLLVSIIILILIAFAWLKLH